MEEAMNPNELMSLVFLEAEKPGNTMEPNKLIAVVLQQPEPIHALSNIDQSNIFFEAIYSQFGHFRQPSNQPISANFDKWVTLVRWLVQELKGWCSESDPHYHKLTTLFVATTFCDFNDRFWISLPPGIEENDALLSTLEKFIGKLHGNFTMPSFGSAPIWEIETVEEFQLADAQGDWLKISELWRSFEATARPNFFLVQIARCLYRFGFGHLVRASNQIGQTIISMQVANSLADRQRLHLGIASNNPYVQFGCAYQTLSHRVANSHLDDEDQKLLMQLLQNVAEDSLKWEQWMQVFNRYPLRYPILQTALGHALAVAPDSAIKAYVEAIRLSTSKDGSRQLVAECLQAFQKVASYERCQMLWSLAYQRWSKWEFGLPDGDDLFQIGYSELDYAVVAYVIECMDDGEREAMQYEILNQLKVLDNIWHSSITDCISSWNCLLSQFQPYAHATQAICLGENWLMENRNYLPFDLKNERYIPMMYQMS